MILLTAVIVFFCGRTIIGGLIQTSHSAQYGIVLGLALENGEPTHELQLRLDTAKAFYEENPDALLILTGGNANENGKTEAAVMYDLMLERGVPADHLITEDQASDTEENFKNTAQLFKTVEPFVLITNDYHMDRAARIAKGIGFQNILRYPAPSPFFHYGANLLWEAVLNINSLLFGS